jgi:hypothetical protein
MRMMMMILVLAAAASSGTMMITMMMFLVTPFMRLFSVIPFAAFCLMFLPISIPITAASALYSWLLLL